VKVKKTNVLKCSIAVALVAVFMVSGCAPITVSSTPSNAKVYMKDSDRLIGTTPVTVNLFANSKELVVRKSGFLSKSLVLSPIDPEMVNVELQRRGKVFLLSQPSGAKLFVAGKREPVGKTPYLIDYGKPYRTFEVRAPGYIVTQYTIADDPEGNMLVELERESSVIVMSNPKNVEVYNHNGTRIGVTPCTVPAGEGATFKLRKEGYYSQEVVIDSETESPLTVKLEREPIIIVYSDPEDAVVTYRGVMVGKTPFRRLVEEDMELEISAERHYTKQVTIAPDSPRRVEVKLDPKPYITVNSSPSRARLYRSGGVELIGSTPIEVLVEKDTAYEMHLPGHAIRPFVLSPESSRTVTVPLMPATAGVAKTVLIDSRPSGALVYRPGGAELIGTTPLEQHLSDERSFELHLDGFKPKVVTVAPDSADNVVFALARDESARNVTISDPLLNTPSSF
jgi:hypothetical protein